MAVPTPSSYIESWRSARRQIHSLSPRSKEPEIWRPLSGLPKRGGPAATGQPLGDSPMVSEPSPLQQEPGRPDMAGDQPLAFGRGYRTS